jgi:maltose/moltooligosaccharide transporter
MLDIQKRLAPAFYAILSLPSTAMGFALSVQISALSWIMSAKYDLQVHEIGLVWAAGPLAGIFGQVIIGLISDQVWFWGGRRRPFILIGGVLAALMLLALPNIDLISSALGGMSLLATAVAVALTLDLAINISFNPTRSIVADVTPPGEQRTKAYAWMQTISGFFGVAAYAVGAIWDNYVLIYFGAALLLVLALVPPFFIEEPRQLPGALETKQKISFSQLLLVIQPLWGYLIFALYAIMKRVIIGENGEGGFLDGLIQGFSVALLFGIGYWLFSQNKQVFGQQRPELTEFQKILFAHSFTWLGIQSMFVYMFSYVQDKLPDLAIVNQGRIVSIAFLIFNLVAALLPALVLAPLSRRIGVVKTHLSCLLVMTFGYVGLYFLGFSILAIYALIAVCGVGWAATVSLPFSILSQKIDQSRMGMYMGLFNLSVTLPQLVSSFGVGLLLSQLQNKSWLFVICALSLGISAILWLFISEPDKTATEKSENTYDDPMILDH